MKIILRITFVLFFGIVVTASNTFAENLIAYTHLTDGFWQIWTMAPDGSNKKQVTDTPVDKRTPSWAENSEKIVYRTNNSELFIIDLDNNEEQEILKKYNNIHNPHYSDINKQVVFVRFDPRGQDISDIWKSDLNGDNTMILTKDRILKYQPKFSPDGKSICYVQVENDDISNHDLWLMNTSGKNRRKLTKDTGFNTLPDFSPDSKYITFTSNRDQGDYEIYLYNVETGEQARLTKSKGLDTSSSFSSDGKKIVYVSGRSGNQQIWVMNANGTDNVQLTYEGESMEPAWK